MLSHHEERLIQIGSRVEYLELRDLQHEISAQVVDLSADFLQAVLPQLPQPNAMKIKAIRIREGTEVTIPGGGIGIVEPWLRRSAAAFVQAARSIKLR